MSGFPRIQKRHSPLQVAAELLDRVLEAAEVVNGLRRVAVISGVGTRRYYAKLGYRLEGDGLFMIKRLPFFAPGWSEALAAPVAHACRLYAAALAPAFAVLVWLLRLALLVPACLGPTHASLRHVLIRAHRA